MALNLQSLVADHCPELPDLPNGRISQPDRSPGGNATMMCDSGYLYTRPHDAVRQCLENGTWSGENGTCEGNDKRIFFEQLSSDHSHQVPAAGTLSKIDVDKSKSNAIMPGR